MAEPVRRVAVVARAAGGPRQDEGVEALHGVMAAAGAELVDGESTEGVDLAVVFGGDGTMLKALQRYLGTGVPVIGVNYGQVGFLTSIEPSDLEDGLRRVLSGDYAVVELPTLEVDAGGERRVAINDVVCTSSNVGRMVELGWTVGGEELGLQRCDGIICCTPSGSTAYNLSSGGPVLVWGLDAMAVTFVAPHSLHARPLVVPRRLDVVIRSETEAIAATVVADGRPFAELARGEEATVRLGAQTALLATLPEQTFFRRYYETFTSARANPTD